MSVHLFVHLVIDFLLIHSFPHSFIHSDMVCAPGGLTAAGLGPRLWGRGCGTPESGVLAELYLQGII